MDKDITKQGQDQISDNDVLAAYNQYLQGLKDDDAVVLEAYDQYKDGLSKEARGNISTLNEQLNEIKSRNYPRSTRGSGNESDKSLQSATQRVIDNLNAKTKDDDSGRSGVVSGLFTKTVGADALSFGLREPGEQMLAIRTLQKANRGEALSEVEQGMFDLLQLRSQVDENIANRGGLTKGSQIGQGIGYSLPMMASFVATGGVGSAAKSGVKKGLTKLGANFVDQTFKEAAQKGAGALLKKSVKDLAGSTVSSLAMTPLQSNTYTNFFARTSDQYSIGEDGSVVKDNETSVGNRLYKSFAESFGEVFSEHLGEGVLGYGVDVLLDVPLKGVRKIIGKGGYKGSQTLADFSQRAMYNGPVSEFAEEMVNNIMTPILIGEPGQIKENFSKENLWVTAGTVMLMGGAFATLELPSVANHTSALISTSNQEKKSLNAIANPRLKTDLFNAVRQETINDQSKALANIDWDGVDQQDAINAVDYVVNRMYSQAIRGAVNQDAVNEAENAVRQSMDYFAYKGENGDYADGDVYTASYNNNDYTVISGAVDGVSGDGMVFARNVITGEVEQIPLTSITGQDSVENLVAMEMAQQESAIEEQNNLQEQQEDINDAIDAGIDPSSISGFKPYENEDRVILNDGRVGTVTDVTPAGYVVETDSDENGNVSIVEPTHNEIQGYENPEQVSQGYTLEGALSEDAVSEEQQAQQVDLQENQVDESNTQDATPTNENSSFPLDKNGNVDFDNLTPEQNFEWVKRNEGLETAINDLIDDVAALDKIIATEEKKLGKLTSGKRTKQRQLIAGLKERRAALEKLLPPTRPAQQAATESLNIEEQDKDNFEDELLNSEDVVGLAQAYEAEKASHDEYVGRHWSQYIVRIKPSGFERFGDKNYITGAIAKNWFSKDGAGIDALAMEISEMSGREITPQDIVDFIVENPNGLRKTSDKAIAFARRFSEVASEKTGRRIGYPSSKSGQEFLRAEQENRRLDEIALEKFEREEEIYYLDQLLSINVEEGYEYFPSEEELAYYDQIRASQTTQGFTSENATGTNGEVSSQEENQRGADTALDAQNGRGVDSSEQSQGGLLGSGASIAEEETRGTETLNSQNQINDAERETAAIERDNDEQRSTDSRGVVDDSTREQTRTLDRGDIRVLEEGLGTSLNAHSVDSERDRREAESQRLVDVAKKNGLFIPIAETTQLGEKNLKRTGESVVYINEEQGKVYKVKNPYAKAALKNGVQPEDVIFEHQIHNLLFPETEYTLEGISEEYGDVHLVLSQNYVQSEGQPTQEQIAEALAKRGLYPEDNYSFGNDLVSVTDVEGDNVLLGDNGELYFIDPIIKFKKPVSEIIDELSQSGENTILFRDGEQFTEEEQSIIDNAGDNAFQAPNGKPTNLTQKQWAQVRTKAFKEWFGDWEKSARIEKLRASEPISISGEEYQSKYELNRDSAKSWLKDNVRGSYVNKDSNDSIEVSRVGVDKVTSHNSQDNVHLKSLIAIPQLIEDSIFIEEATNEKGSDKYDSYRYYVAGIDIGGIDYTAKVVVGVKQGVKYYDHSLTEIEKGNLIEAANGFTTTGNASVPSYTESKDKRLISLLQTNSSKVVDANGEPLVVYHSTNDEFSEFDIKKLGDNSGDFGTRGAGFYFSPSWEVSSMYGYIDMSMYLNLSNPMVMEFDKPFYSNFKQFESVSSAKLKDSEKTIGELIDDYKKISAQIDNGELVEDGSLSSIYGKKEGARVFARMQLRKMGYPAEAISFVEMPSGVFMENVIGSTEFTDALKKVRYDGVIDIGSNKEYVAFNPNQIKSATDNTGAFSEESDDIRFRQAQEVNDKFNSDLQSQIDGTLPESHVYQLGRPSGVLRSAGFPNLPIEITQKRLRDKSNQEDHPFDLSELENLPLAIQNPIAVFRSATRLDSEVIFTELAHNGKNFVVAVQMNTSKGRISVNSIRSVHYRSSNSHIANWINEGLLEYVDKTKISDWFSKQRYNSADVRKSFRDATKIVENFENPKIEGEDLRFSKEESQEESPRQARLESYYNDIMGDQVSEEYNVDEVVGELSNKLNTEVTIIRDTNEITDSDPVVQRRKRKSKGWYDTKTGKVYVVASNNTSNADVQATVLHEVVGHRGMRALLGDKFDTFLDRVADSLGQEISGRTDAVRRNNAEEYIARIAERNVTPGVFMRVVSTVKNILRDMLGLDLKMTDNDIAYMLYLSKNNLSNIDNAADMISEVSKRKEVKDVLFRDAERRDTNGQVFNPKSKKDMAIRAFVDDAVPIQRLQETLEARGSKITDATDVYKVHNHYSSRVMAGFNKSFNDFQKPIAESMAEILKAAESAGVPMTFDDICDYTACKHGVERQDSGINVFSKKENSMWTYENALALIERVEGSIDAKLIDDFWEKVNALTAHNLEERVAGGLMGKEDLKEIRNNGWKFYVPLKDVDLNAKTKDGKQEVVDPTEEFLFNDVSRRGTGLGKLHKAEGRTTKPANPIAELFSDSMRNVTAVEKNRVNRATYNLVRNNAQSNGVSNSDLFRVSQMYLRKNRDNGEWYESQDENPPSREEVERSAKARADIKRLSSQREKLEGKLEVASDQTKIDAINEEIKNIDAEIAKAEDNNTVSFKSIAGARFKKETPINGSLEQQRHVYCMINGLSYRVTFADPAVSNAINNSIDTQAMHWIVKGAGLATRGLSRMFTTLNPTFVLPNFVRDIGMAGAAHWMNSESSILTFGSKLASSTVIVARNLKDNGNPLTLKEMNGRSLVTPEGYNDLVEQYGKIRVEDTLYELFLQNGGQTGFIGSKSLKTIENDIKADVFIAGGVGSVGSDASTKEAFDLMTKKTGRLGMSAARKGVKIIESLSEWSEDTSRFATFLTSLEMGRSTLSAIDDAKNITANFNRSGTFNREAGAFFAFFNATIQGSVAIAKVGSKNKVRFAALAATLATLGYLNSWLVEYALDLSDDDDEAMAYDMENNLVIPLFVNNGNCK